MDGVGKNKAPGLFTAIGLMSGTSLDGVDAALLVTDGQHVINQGPTAFIAYEPALRKQMRDLLPYAHGARQAWGLSPAAEKQLRGVEADLTEVHARAIEMILAQYNQPVDVIGFHGQTVSHRPDLGWTWQIGDGAHLADLCGLPVVTDFRAADMEKGGQGAPLAPIFHQALWYGGRSEGPVVIANIGGVANVTWIGGRQHSPSIVAFDTGPGNGPLDDWIQSRFGQPYDKDGYYSGQGTVDKQICRNWMRHPYFASLPPKSLDRMDFKFNAAANLDPYDGAATLAAFTVESMACASRFFPKLPIGWFITGGGRHNPTIMTGLSEALNLPVEPVEAIGWSGDFLEAQLFAYLAVRHLKGLPFTLPETSGCSMPTTGGHYYA